MLLFFLIVTLGVPIVISALLLFVRFRTCRFASLRLAPSAVTEDATGAHTQLGAGHPLKVIFVHPDLGIGGAERLVVDAAVALQKHQHIAQIEVIVVTNHHDPKRAFTETVNGTVKVVVFGSWIPRTVFGTAKVFCATLRMYWATLMACIIYPETDCYFVDQVAAVLPLLSLLAPYSPRLFYCHFPDQCCDSNRDECGRFRKPPSRWRRWYRCLFDEIELQSMNFASSIVSNSKFSRDMTVNEGPSALKDSIEGHSVILSINRYERKKNLALAIEAFAHVVSTTESCSTRSPLLVLAGGYDPRLAENVSHFKELQNLAWRHGLHTDQVLFLKNISETEKRFLLSNCCCLLYTPTSEHFGIVPIEAMVCARPVVAVNQGGPCESVGEGGTLCEPTTEAFARAIETYLCDEELCKQVGLAGQRRARERFGIDTFGVKLATRFVKLWTERSLSLSKASTVGKDYMQQRKVE
uniref:Alpha-1,3/1,6-mannosyltransferase ALG2 n=1 Tax=Trypanosoma vivax (strain Y486) TaxID=1055687 RepID=G0TUA4_TRYVY|nr:putative glycosyltransferase ALG2, fragment [Trypanosoma vivax Y486]